MITYLQKTKVVPPGEYRVSFEGVGEAIVKASGKMVTVLHVDNVRVLDKLEDEGLVRFDDTAFLTLIPTIATTLLFWRWS